MTCERCGADAVDERGTCQACGWRAADQAFDAGSSSPSLAETRAADVPIVARTPLIARQSTPGSFADQDRWAPSFPAGSTSRPGTRGPAGRSTGLFCGTCGARIEPGEQFCGQCGTPVFAGGSGADHGTSLRPAQPAPSRYGSAESWTPADNDAPTMSYSDMQGELGPGYPGRMGSGIYDPHAEGMGRAPANRELRIVFGLLCILGGLVSGAGAIVLAFAH
ncbi:MAG TPA: zinc ribbon domain-containing protein [Ktedonobacterales bacterium]